MTNSVRSIVMEMLKRETARDRQRLIGPSSLGNPCDYDLAKELLEGGASDEDDDREPDERPYWLGAVLGTSIHLLLESRAPEGMPAENRVRIGEITGYGVISGSTDLFIPELKTVLDWKSTNRIKLKNLKLAFDTKYTTYDPEPLVQARFTAKKYVGQAMTYGWGWEQAGYDVEQIAFAFICRDGLTDNDVWVKEMPYDRAYAERVWDRANRIWVALQGERELSSFLSRAGCWSCMTTQEPRKFSKKPF